MRRREVIALIGSAAAVSFFRAHIVGAQEPGRTYKLGVIQGSARQAPRNVAFFDELRGLGFVEGQNLKIIVDGFGLRDQQFAEAAATLAKSARTLSFAPVILRCAPHRNRPGPFPSSASPAIWSLRVLCARSPAPAAMSPASALRSKSMANDRTSSWRPCLKRGVSHSLRTQPSSHRRSFRHFRTPLVRAVSTSRSLQPRCQTDRADDGQSQGMGGRCT